MKIFISLSLTIYLFTQSLGNIIQVGPSRTVKSPAAAAALVADNDTVAIDGDTFYTVAGDILWKKNNLLILGTGSRPRLQISSVGYVSKAIFVVQGNGITIDNIEFTGSKVAPEITGIRNGAGIRIEGRDLTIRRCYIHHNEEAVLGGVGGFVKEEYSEFAYNGTDGYTHNTYIATTVDSFILRFCYSHHAIHGHCIKSRAITNLILCNRIMDEAEGNSSYILDLPNGGTSWVIGNLFEQGPNADNPTLLTYGEEGLTHPGTALYVVNNTFVNDRNSGSAIFIRVAAGAVPAVVTNNLFVGSAALLSGPGTQTTNASSNTPNFVNRSGYDFRTTASSPGIDQGSSPGFGNGISLTPEFQYVHPCQSEPRSVVNNTIDIGAYEFGNDIAVEHQPVSPNTKIGMLPNPCSRTRFSSLCAQWRSSSTEFSVLDISGKRCISIPAAGIYWLKVSERSGTCVSKLVLVD